MDAKLFVPAILAALSTSAMAAELPAGCENAARATVAAATSADGNDDGEEVAKSLKFTSVKVTKRGEIPPADGVTDINFTAKFTSESFARSGTMKFEVIRGGCLLTEFKISK